MWGCNSVKNLLKVCVAIGLHLMMSSIQAQTAVQCVKSLIELRGQDLLLKKDANISTSDSSGFQHLSLTRECVSAGLQEGRVSLGDGKLQYVQLLGRSSEGVMVHQFDPKTQLSLYARLAHQSPTPVAEYLNIFRQEGLFVYQLQIVNGLFFESISWGVAPVRGDIHAY